MATKKIIWHYLELRIEYDRNLLAVCIFLCPEFQSPCLLLQINVSLLEEKTNWCIKQDAKMTSLY